jgi:hypothetical protein
MRDWRLGCFVFPISLLRPCAWLARHEFTHDSLACLRIRAKGKSEASLLAPSPTASPRIQVRDRAQTRLQSSKQISYPRTNESGRARPRTQSGPASSTGILPPPASPGVCLQSACMRDPRESIAPVPPAESLPPLLLPASCLCPGLPRPAPSLRTCTCSPTRAQSRGRFPIALILLPPPAYV